MEKKKTSIRIAQESRKKNNKPDILLDTLR